MKKLAIIGHPIEGNKIIEILKMLGGKNKDGDAGWKCKNPQLAYYIDDTGWIEFINICNPNKNILRYTLEEFLEKFPYMVGDKVLYYGNPVFITQIEWIEDSVSYHFYHNGRELMLPVNHLQPYKEETAEEEENFGECIEKTIQECLFGKQETRKEIKIEIPRGYEFSGVCNQQMVFTRIQPKYPKTYEECCDILKIPNDERYIDIDVPLDYNKLLYAFTELLICRNAYWKIAGEQVGLGKPWEPDLENEELCCIQNYNNQVVKSKTNTAFNKILTFPTEEIRDAFLENFKELIELCKKLL